MARPSLLTDNQLKMIQKNAYLGMLDKHWVAKELNVSERTAERTIKKLNCYHTKQNVIEMIRKYQEGESYQSIIKEYNISQANFHALLRKRGIKARHSQYIADFNYFDDINTEAKAYFLGFIYADGCLYRNTLKISISKVDVDILQKLTEEMKANHPIREIADGTQVEIQISQDVLKDALNKHGVVPAKTHKLECIPSTIPSELTRHFIRGYFDGDGSFSCYELKSGQRIGDHKYSFGIVGTESFLEDVRQYVQSQAGIKLSGKLQQRWDRNNNTRSLVGSGKQQTLTFVDWLYKDANMYLDRKYQKYRQLLR